MASSSAAMDSSMQSGQGDQVPPPGVSPATQSSPINPPQPAAQHQPLPKGYSTGHHQVPFAPYTPQPMAMYPNTAMPTAPPESKTWTFAKLILTALSLVWAVVVFGLAISIVTAQDADYWSYSIASLVIALPVSIVSLLWNAAELITFGARMRQQIRRGIHPGAHVGMYLVLWLAGVIVVFATAASYSFFEYIVEDCNPNEDNNVDYYSHSDYYECNTQEGFAAVNKALGLSRALLALWCLATVNHFVLFVLACIDTRRRNVMRRARVFMYPTAMPPPAAPYHYPMAPMAPSGAAPQMPADPSAHPTANPALGGYYSPAPAMGAAPSDTAANPALAGFYAPGASSAAR